VKVTIQHSTDVPDGEIPDTRTLGVLEFVPGDSGSIPTLVLPERRIEVNPEDSLVVHSAYSPHNHGLSVMVGYHSAEGMTHVFTALTRWGASLNTQSYFAFRLPTGQLIDLYFQDD
jgi:hypothetical protein